MNRLLADPNCTTCRGRGTVEVPDTDGESAYWEDCHCQREPLDLSPIEARANNATPGPWQWHNSARTRDYRLQNNHWDVVMGFTRWGRDSAQPEFNIDGLLHKATELTQPHPDAEFIAHARQDITDLLAEIHRLRTALLPRCDSCQDPMTEPDADSRSCCTKCVTRSKAYWASQPGPWQRASEQEVPF